MTALTENDRGHRKMSTDKKIDHCQSFDLGQKILTVVKKEWSWSKKLTAVKKNDRGQNILNVVKENAVGKKFWPRSKFWPWPKKNDRGQKKWPRSKFSPWWKKMTVVIFFNRGQNSDRGQKKDDRG